MNFKDKFYIPISMTRYMDCDTNSSIEDFRIFGILIYRRVSTLLYRADKFK